MARSAPVAAVDPEPGKVVHWPTPESKAYRHRHPPWAPAEGTEPSDHPLGRPQILELDHYAVSLSQKLDRAEGWDCPNGAYCENRAHVGKLHVLAEEAREFVPTHSLEWTKQVLNLRPPDLAAAGLIAEGPLPRFYIVHVEGTIVGYDYRPTGCQIPDAFEQLWRSEGTGPAWQRVLAHRARHGAHAAALPGRTSGGLFFAFLTGCEDLTMTSVDVVPGRLPEGFDRA
jgi:hypothetical protein